MATTTTTTQVLLQLQLVQAAETHLLLQQLLHQVLLEENRIMIICAQLLRLAYPNDWVAPHVHM